MPYCVAQEIRWLLADEFDRRSSAARRLAKARLAATLAEGLDRARIADLRAGLSDGARAAFLDARLSVAERQIVVTALSHDPGERAEISSAAALLDCAGSERVALPPGLAAKAVAVFAAEHAAAPRRGARRTRRRQASLLVGIGLAALVLFTTAASGLRPPGEQGVPSAAPASRSGAGRAPEQAIAEAAPLRAPSAATGRARPASQQAAPRPDPVPRR